MSVEPLRRMNVVGSVRGLARRRWAWIGAALTLVIVAAVVVYLDRRATGGWSVPGREIGSGVRVDGPSDIVDKLTAKAVPDSALNADNDRVPRRDVVLQHGPVVDIRPGGYLHDGRKVKLAFALKRPPRSGENVILAVKAQGDRWSYHVPTLVNGRRTAVLETDHLAWWAVLTLNTKKVQGWLTSEFDKLRSDRLAAPAEKPICDGEDTARRNGYSAESTRADTKTDGVLWCLGTHEGQYVLKLVNNRPYVADLVGESGITILDHGDVHRSALDQGLEQTARLGVGVDRTTVYPREQIVVSVTPNAQAARVSVQYGGWADSMNQLQTGSEVLLGLLNRLGIGANTSAIKTADVIASSVSCNDALNDRPSSADIAKGCFTPAGVAAATGGWGLQMAPFLAVGPVIDTFRTRLGALFDRFNGSSKYTVSVTTGSTTPPPASGESQPAGTLEAFVRSGPWKVHGSTLTVHSDGSGTLVRNTGPCANPGDGNGNADMCSEIVHLRLAVSGSGLAATVMAAQIVKQGSEETPPDDACEACSDARRHVGQSMTISWLASDGRTLTNHVLSIDWPGVLNPTAGWCGNLATTDETSLCGA